MSKSLKAIIDSERPFFGPSAVLGSTRMTEILARAGSDFLLVDMQHGVFDKPTVTDSIRAVLATDTIPLARVSDNIPGLINDVLDAGAMGVVVPMVETAEQAEAAVRAALYPPRGARSKGSTPSAVHGSRYYTDLANEIAVVVMIETPEGVANADGILATPGVGMCLVGTSDLSFSIGCSRDAPEISEALTKIVKAGARYHVPVGAAVDSLDRVAPWRALGVRFFLTPHDQRLLVEASSRWTKDMREALQC